MAWRTLAFFLILLVPALFWTQIALSFAFGDKGCENIWYLMRRATSQADESGLPQAYSRATMWAEAYQACRVRGTWWSK